MGNDVFKDCSKLSSFKDDVFNMPINVGNNVFENCDFKKINIKYNGLLGETPTIGKNVFKNNKNLLSVTMDHILLGENMFDGCSSLSLI
jgi:hypothetical protein